MRPLRRRLAGLGLADQARTILRRGFMPFESGRALNSVERRRVAYTWGIAGAVFACAWVGVLAALPLGLGRGRGVWVALALVPIAGALFAALGYLVSGFGNRLLGGGGRDDRGP